VEIKIHIFVTNKQPLVLPIKDGPLDLLMKKIVDVALVLDQMLLFLLHGIVTQLLFQTHVQPLFLLRQNVKKMDNFIQLDP
jgi:hypothetical protein